MSDTSNWKKLHQAIKSNEFDHYSFDFWRTIAFSNPQFKTSRTRIISAELKSTVADSQILEAFENTGKFYNELMEKKNNTVSSNALNYLVLNNLGIHLEQSEKIIEEINEAFLTYPPHLGEGFLEVFSDLSQANATKSITSNTAFIPGTVIQQFIDDSPLKGLFSFCLFSDEVNTAKPHNAMYALMVRETQQLNPDIDMHHIIHIGDNANSDVFGAQQFGIHSLLVS